MILEIFISIKFFINAFFVKKNILEVILEKTWRPVTCWPRSTSYVHVSCSVVVGGAAHIDTVMMPS